MNIKNSLFILLFFYTTFCFSGEYDYEKMYSESNIALGIPADARGNRYELLNAAKSANGGGATLFGMTGTALSGLNPFSPANTSIASGLSLAFTLLTPSKNKSNKKIYKGYEPNQKYFAPFRINQDDSDYILSVHQDLVSKFSESLSELQVPGAEIVQTLMTQYETKTDSQGNHIRRASWFKFILPDGSNYSFMLQLKKMTDDEQKAYPAETQKSNPFNSKINFIAYYSSDMNKGGTQFVNPEHPAFALVSPAFQSFSQKIQHVIFSNDIRTIFYDGNIYSDLAI